MLFDDVKCEEVLSVKRHPKHNKVAFKQYEQSCLEIPMSLDSMIPDKHVVRVVNNVINNINLQPLIDKYNGGGTSSYHPAMMLKLLIYAYIDKEYSSRRIEKATRENINYMWLCGLQRPDHKTINNFRSQRMKEVVETVFYEVVEALAVSGYINLQNYFLDGTKIEANASKYSFVWGKNTKRFKSKLRDKCKELLATIEETNAEEERRYGEDNLEECGDNANINSETLKTTAEMINDKLITEPKNKVLKKAKRQLEKDYIPRMEKYEQQERDLVGRNSLSKTDKEATFMRMKEDHMRNGQLKPGYNVQIGTENQFIIGFSVHQTAGDTTTMQEHIERVKSRIKSDFPINVIADAGYGSEENYEYLERHGHGNYVKYNTFHKEVSKKWRNDPSKVQNWFYREESDEYICWQGRYFSFQYEQKSKSKNGYISTVRIYESEGCAGCLIRDKCIKNSDNPDANKRIAINRRLNELKERANANLNSEYGKKMRSLRPIEPESAFGNIKGNFGVRRFMLRGLEKVSIKWGLYSIAHNFRKMAVLSAG